MSVPHEGMYCPLSLRAYGLPVVVDPGWPEGIPGALTDEFFDMLAEIFRRH